VELIVASGVPGDVDVVGIPVASGPTAVGDTNGHELAELAARGFEGKTGETMQLNGAIAVGVGDLDKVTPDVIRKASAALVKAAWKRPRVASRLLDAVADDTDRPAAAQAAAEGAVLAGYRFGRYKREAKATQIEAMTIVSKGGKRVGAAAERGRAIAEAVNFARDLINTPSGDLTPVGLADAATEVAERAGLTIEITNEKQAAKLGLGGLTSVGKGSDNPPRMVKLVYDPPGARNTLAWVGKGITFDSGGLSLKTGEGMMTMKHDMAGAAAVLGAMSVLADLGVRTKVIDYLCAAENMPSGHAIRPGDVLTIKNGTTVEVLNTDAEGRLVLADGLALAVDDGPDAIVDLATLTGAVRAALGTRFAGLMGNRDWLTDQVRDASVTAGEPAWPLPLPPEYRKMLDSPVADIKNVASGGTAGALVAGLFLQEFVADVPWAHLDIAGPAWVDDDSDPMAPRGGTGYGVRTLLALAESFKPVKGKR